MKDNYAAEVKERWGMTPEYIDYSERSHSSELRKIEENELMDIFAEFGTVRHIMPSSEIPQALVKKLQNYISGHFYSCSDEALSGLGEMYVSDERFRNNIDARAGEGTAEFVSRAIEHYTEKNRIV